MIKLRPIKVTVTFGLTVSGHKKARISGLLRVE
jgi:hypothetical protein